VLAVVGGGGRRKVGDGGNRGVVEQQAVGLQRGKLCVMFGEEETLRYNL
jgi:hypothetical protein